MLFKVVVQAVLIFGAEMWVMNLRIGRALGGFQHRFVQQITGRKPRLVLDGIWDYPSLETAIQELGFEEMEEYLMKRQNKVAQ